MVGTDDSGASMRSTAADFTPFPFLKMKSLATIILNSHRASDILSVLTRRWSSRTVPSSGIFPLGTRQCGQGHAPKFRIVANKTLRSNMLDEERALKQFYLLFRIIS
jgi:hypothetical protein